MKEEAKALANYRFERSSETKEEAQILLSQGKINGAMSRVYYALFYAAKALLATKELDSSKHAAVIALFHREFVKPEIVSKNNAKLLNQAFELRAKGDYKDFYQLTKEQVEEIILQSNVFLEEIREILKQKNVF
jgi:uncharacterized protein (UPF0332 family)